jgi:hypothetical protein
MLWGVALFWIVAALSVGLGVTRPALSGGDALGAQGPAQPQARRGFLGMPMGGTITLQRLGSGSTSATAQRQWSESADITVTYALSNGTPVKTSSGSIAAESTQIYTPTQGFTGLGRVEAIDPGTQAVPVFAVNSDLSGAGNDAYLGLAWPDEPAGGHHRYFVPLALRGYWTTMFTIQNRNAVTPTNVQVEFYNESGFPSLAEPMVIPAGGAVSYDLATMWWLPVGGYYSVVISSDYPVAVASVRTYNEDQNVHSAYPGPDSTQISTMLVAPALFKASDLQTSELWVQNAGSANSQVRVTYTDGVVNTATIPPNAARLFDQAAEAHADGWAGGATITSTEPIAAIVNVTAGSGYTPVGRWSYTVPSTATLGSAAAFPLLNNRHEGWTSKIYLYNTGSSAAVITPRYVGYPSGFVSCSQQITIAAGGMISISQADLSALNSVSMGYLTSTEKVAAVVGFTSDKTLGTTDRHMGYEAAYPTGTITPQKQCGTIHTVFLPVVIRQTP